MRAYSTDLKERLVRAAAHGLPMREVARRFEVAVTTVKRAVVQQRTTGSLEHRPSPGRPRAIRREQEAIVLASAADRTRRHRAGALRLVGRAVGPAAE
jgi:transposase